MNVVQQNGVHMVYAHGEKIGEVRRHKMGHVIYTYDGVQRVLPTVERAVARILEREELKRESV